MAEDGALAAKTPMHGNDVRSSVDSYSDLRQSPIVTGDIQAYAQ